MGTRTQFGGPALFSYGFRPFFLAAILFAVCVVPVWVAVWRGSISLPGPFSAVDWHIHEMVFGYGAAVVAGFLFTAVPNWTGRLPTQGWPLLILLSLWMLGRIAVAGAFGLVPAAVMVIDLAFLLAVAMMVAREIIAGKNWRNLKVMVPVTVLWIANFVFHAEAMTSGTADVGRRFGIAVLVFLIMLIGGRIVPSFTRNWLAKRNSPQLPVPFGRFDAVSLFVGAVGLMSWTLVPLSQVAGIVLLIAALLHLVRLVRWRGQLVLSDPLLLMLHAAYLFIPIGLFAAGMAAFGLVGAQVCAHLFGIGVVGGMTMAVMMRATMGHTGRALAADRILVLSFILLLLSALVRTLGGVAILHPLSVITSSAILWTLSFGLLWWRIGPWLTMPKSTAA